MRPPSNSTRRGWFMGCGGCGGSHWVRNAKIEWDTECEDCAGAGVDPAGSSYCGDSLVATELGWCGCGDPRRIDAMMLAYLESRTGEDWPKPDPVDVSPDAAILLAFMADDLGWTEHGTSVNVAWLTADGQEALDSLRAAAQDTRRTDP